MNDKPMYVTVAEAALWLDCTERTVRRWMTGRLLAIYKRDDGKLVLELAELNRVHRAQKQRDPVRSKLRAQRFAQVASMSYPRD